jgi:hypothetical protein
MTKPKLLLSPACRYGHGDLDRVALKNGEDEPRGMFLPTFRDIVGVGPALVDGSGYTIAAFRCATCGYIELFDDEALNGR